MSPDAGNVGEHDHIFSITIAWWRHHLATMGYQMVFCSGAGIALINLVSAQLSNSRNKPGLLAVEPPEISVQP